MQILLVEDDKAIASGLAYSLNEEGYDTRTCGTVREAREALQQGGFGLCLLDLSLPDGSGYDLCRIAKETGDIPVIFLTACDDEVNVVMGLDLGADDYITKPFRVRELLSRIKSVLRRYAGSVPGTQKHVFQYGNIRVHTLEAKVYKDGKEILLTALEYRLLLTFINNAGKVLSRAQLLEGIWDVAGNFVNDNTLTVYIKRLRDKLEDDPQNPAFIQTVRGLGYRAGESDA